MAKRLFDIVLSGLGLLCASPLFLVISLWILVEKDGPVFFRQRRVGLNGVPFELIKFRTMVPSNGAGDEAGVTTSGHPRVKRASGRVLRRTKLDELPQLFNVLRGEMSLVGPRPELDRYVRHYSDQDRKEVLSLRPGITDLAALRFSDEEAILADREDPERFYVQHILPEKIALYKQYVRRRSLLYDVSIILLTIAALLVRPLRDRIRWRDPWACQ